MHVKFVVGWLALLLCIVHRPSIFHLIFSVQWSVIFIMGFHSLSQSLWRKNTWQIHRSHWNFHARLYNIRIWRKVVE